jgi:hypothetical protein
MIKKRILFFKKTVRTDFTLNKHLRKLQGGVCGKARIVS